MEAFSSEDGVLEPHRRRLATPHRLSATHPPHTRAFAPPLRSRYDMLKTVHIKSKRVGFIFRALQLVILGYIIGYAIVAQKGYQEVDSARSSVISKVRVRSRTLL